MKKALIAVTAVIALPSTAHAAGTSAYIPYNLSSATYSQDFDTLASTGSSDLLPAGFQLVEQDTGSRADGAYTAGTGSSNSGDAYSFGADGSSERALGSLGSGTNDTIYFGGVFTNGLGSDITELLFAYTGEQWRSGTAGFDALAFEFSTDATDLTDGNWVGISALDFIAVNFSGVGAIDGNASPNQSEISYAISGLSIAAGSNFGFRWYDTDNTGSDHGLAIDDLTISATTAAVPEPSSWALLMLGIGFVGAALRRKSGANPVFA